MTVCCTCEKQFKMKPDDMFVIDDIAHIICESCQREFAVAYLDLLFVEVELSHDNKISKSSGNQKIVCRKAKSA